MSVLSESSEDDGSGSALEPPIIDPIQEEQPQKEEGSPKKALETVGSKSGDLKDEDNFG